MTQPTDPVAIEFIRGVAPAFYFAASGDQLAVATDVTAMERFHFTDVAITGLSRDGELATSAPVDITMQLVGLVGGDGTPRFIGLADVSFSGQIAADGFGETLTVTGTISVQDVVDLLIELVGFDEEGSRAFLANVYETTIEDLPAFAPFTAILALGD